MRIKGINFKTIVSIGALFLAHYAGAGTAPSGFGWEIAQTGTDPHGLYQWDFFMGPFLKDTPLVGIQISLSMAQVPDWLGPDENGFNETLLTVTETGGWAPPSFTVTPQMNQGQYIAGDTPGALARLIIKGNIAKHTGETNQTVYIPLNGIVIPAGQAIKFSIAHIGPNSDVELQGTLQYQQ